MSRRNNTVFTILTILYLLLVIHPFSHATHFTGYTVTDSSASYYGKLFIDGVNPDAGDEIGAFGDDGSLYGAVIVTQESGAQGWYPFLNIYGDDATTPAKDGAKDGETITFKIWDKSSAKEYSGSELTYTKPIWKDKEISQVDIVAATTTTTTTTTTSSTTTTVSGGDTTTSTTTTTTTTTTSTSSTTTASSSTSTTSTSITTTSTTTSTTCGGNPIISGLSLKSGSYLDEVIISGNDFCDDGEVTFSKGGDPIIASITGWTDSEIGVIVPWGCKTGLNKVIVTPLSGVGSNNAIFKILKPKPRITGLGSQNGKIGFEITITGEIFGEDDGMGVVSFGGKEAEIVQWSNESITAKVPPMKLNKNGKKTVTVKVKTIYGFSNGKMFQVVK